MPLASTAQTQAWVQDAAQRLQLDPIWVQSTLAQAQRLPSVERLVLPPSSPTAKNWAAYRARFIEPIRIQAGIRFWQNHRSALERAEREYGVPASLIVGIIGVETLYGQNTGNFRILDALAKKSVCIIVQKEDFLRPDMAPDDGWRARLRCRQRRRAAPGTPVPWWRTRRGRSRWSPRGKRARR
jgi:membrane-bound lytic murein transglycosylase B